MVSASPVPNNPPSDHDPPALSDVTRDHAPPPLIIQTSQTKHELFALPPALPPAIPQIMVNGATPAPSTSHGDNSSTLGQITDLTHDHDILSSGDDVTRCSEMVEVDITVTHRVSYKESPLLKDPQNHPSKIIHVPSSTNPDKIRGYLVPKGFTPDKKIRRSTLPPESVPLKCQHEVPPGDRKQSCTLHNHSGFICSCVMD